MFASRISKPDVMTISGCTGRLISGFTLWSDEVLRSLIRGVTGDDPTHSFLS